MKLANKFYHVSRVLEIWDEDRPTLEIMQIDFSDGAFDWGVGSEDFESKEAAEHWIYETIADYFGVDEALVIGSILPIEKYGAIEIP